VLLLLLLSRLSAKPYAVINLLHALGHKYFNPSGRLT